MKRTALSAPKLPSMPRLAFKHGGRVKAMPSTMAHQGVPKPGRSK